MKYSNDSDIGSFLDKFIVSRSYISVIIKELIKWIVE